MTERLQMKDDVGGSELRHQAKYQKVDFKHKKKWFTVDALSYIIKTWALTELLR